MSAEQYLATVPGTYQYIQRQRQQEAEQQTPTQVYTAPQPFFVDLDVIMRHPELTQAFGQTVVPTTVPLDLDVIMQAGTQVKHGTPEEQAWFKSLVSRYGQPTQAYQVVEPPPPSWRETTVAGQLYSGKWRGFLGQYFPSMNEPFRIIERRGPMGEFAAGLIAVPESWLRPEVPTPMGAVVGKVFGQTSAYETGEVSPFYLAGGIAGTWAESYGIGKVAGYAYRGIKAITPKFIKEAVYSAKESVRFSRAAKALTEAKWTIQRNVPYWKVIAPFKKIVATQEITELSAKGFKQVGLKELELVEASWLIRMAPKTGGVWISRAGEMVTTREGFKVLSKVGGYWALREVMHTPLISQTQVTRMGIHPYVPKMATVTQTTGRVGQALISPTLVSIPKVLQITKPKKLQRETLVPALKPYYSTFAEEREKFRVQELLRTEPLRRQREDLVPVLKVTQFTRAIPKRLVTPVSRVPVPVIPKLPIPTFRFPTILLGGGSSGGGGSKSLFGKWYRKQQLIKTPKEMMRTFFGGPSPSKRRRRRKR